MTDLADNVGTVNAIYAAFGRADIAAILDLLTDDVDWATEGPDEAAPWYGVRHGKDEVAKFFQDIGGALEVHEFAPLSVLAGENEVHALVRFRISSRATGRQGEMNLHHYWRLRDGKVEYYRGSEDSAQTAALLAA